jgi:hypothetical protein
LDRVKNMNSGGGRERKKLDDVEIFFSSEGRKCV